MNDTVVPLHYHDGLPPRADRDWATSAEVITETGVTYRQLDYWTRVGLVTPVRDPRPGSGFLRIYTADQLDRVRAIAELLAAGVTLATIRHVIDEYATEGHAVLGPITITRTGAAS